MVQKAIGPTFGQELRAAGVQPGHYTWSADGTIEFFEDTPAPLQAQVLAVYVAHDPAKKLPDPAGFIQGLKAALGGVVQANSLAKAYPLFQPAIELKQWDDVEALVEDALAHGALTGGQYAAIKSTAAEYSIPIDLP